MTTSPYPGLQGSATRVVRLFGRDVTVVSVADGDPATKDPAKPWVPATPVETRYPTRAIFDKVSREFVNGTTVLETDETVVFPVADVPVLLGPKDYLLDGSDRCAVIKSAPIQPGDTPILGQLVVRR